MKKALVYNFYLQTAGGGERLSLDICLALSKLGYQITIATSPLFQRSLDSLCRVFGLPTDLGWHLVRFETEEAVFEYCRLHSFDVFVNGTFCSSLKNPARVGIYPVMFPQFPDQEVRARLLTYQLILCISDFTEIYTKAWWGQDDGVRTLPPPISESHASYSDVIFEAKEKLILNVGRFNVDGHCKRQLDAIRVFNRLRAKGILDSDWKLFLVGNLNEGEHNRRYLEQCFEEASLGVHIETDVPFERIQSLYRSASVLWQFTGYGLPYGESPQYCEHLGLVALDSLHYGTLPIVYERSGVAHMIRYGETGFVFSSTSELERIMDLVDKFFGSWAHRELFQNACKASTELDFNSFVGKLDAYISELAA